jgi:hypothetical protein
MSSPDTDSFSFRPFYVAGGLYRYNGNLCFVYSVELNRFRQHYRIRFIDALGVQDDLLFLRQLMPERTWKNPLWERIS